MHVNPRRRALRSVSRPWFTQAPGAARFTALAFATPLLAASLFTACSSEDSTPGATTSEPTGTTSSPIVPTTTSPTPGPATSVTPVAPSVTPQPTTAPAAPSNTSGPASSSTTTEPSSAPVGSPEDETSSPTATSPAETSGETSDDVTPEPSHEAATVVPDASWACGAAAGLPPPALGELVFEATLQLGDTHEFGETPFGTRRLLDVTGGTFTGDRISGTFLTGGLDLELVLSNGNLELEQIDILRASDGTHIFVRTCGFAPSGAAESRFVPDFEAPNSSAHAWLNTGKFAGTRKVAADGKSIQLAIYDISNVTLPETKITLEDPDGVPDQPWDCTSASGSRGATVLTETVTLGQSISIGASKRGSRNIIPITGGTVSGRLTGTVVPGGADYQLIGNTTVLDAKYTLRDQAGEYVLVRNCGPFGAMAPLFEARKDGPYAFLNEGRYLSSDPGGAQGGVSITFYEAQ
jgi:hypothetical protein